MLGVRLVKVLAILGAQRVEHFLVFGVETARRSQPLAHCHGFELGIGLAVIGDPWRCAISRMAGSCDLLSATLPASISVMPPSAAFLTKTLGAGGVLFCVRRHGGARCAAECQEKNSLGNVHQCALHELRSVCGAHLAGTVRQRTARRVSGRRNSTHEFSTAYSGIPRHGSDPATVEPMKQYGTTSSRRAGPSGLSVALILGRARRSAPICDPGTPRSWASKRMYAYLSRDSIEPASFRQTAAGNSARYPKVEMRDVEVTRARKRLANRDHPGQRRPVLLAENCSSSPPA